MEYADWDPDDAFPTSKQAAEAMDALRAPVREYLKAEAQAKSEVSRQTLKIDRLEDAIVALEKTRSQVQQKPRKKADQGGGGSLL